MVMRSSLDVASRTMAHNNCASSSLPRPWQPVLHVLSHQQISRRICGVKSDFCILSASSCKHHAAHWASQEENSNGEKPVSGRRNFIFLPCRNIVLYNRIFEMPPQANVKLLTTSVVKIKIAKDFKSGSEKTSWGVKYSCLDFRRHSQDVVNWFFVIPSVTMRLPLASPEDRTTEPNGTRLTVCILKILVRRQVIVLTASLQVPDQPLRVRPVLGAGSRPPMRHCHS
jgi:hypothetical protein